MLNFVAEMSSVISMIYQSVLQVTCKNSEHSWSPMMWLWARSRSCRDGLRNLRRSFQCQALTIS